MSDCISSFPQVIKKWTRSLLVAKFSSLIAKMDRISPSSFLDRVPQDRDEISSVRKRERERAFFIHITFQTLCQADLWEKIYIICDFFRIVYKQREKSYRVCHFRSLLSLISHPYLSFLLFLYFFRELSFPPKLQYTTNASSRSFSLSILVLNSLIDSSDERKDQDATRIENVKWRSKIVIDIKNKYKRKITIELV